MAGDAVARVLGSLRWRCIGPHRGGRVVAVAGHPHEPMVFYFGSTGGGVWRTDDGGVTWRNVSDGYFRRASVGAIAVAPSDPNVLYVGMGECCIRNNVSHGDGVYRSTDGGRSWVHLGLADSQQIARVRIHPEDPDRVYVAALGHVYGPNATRGVFRSRDGGRTWERVLFRSERTGAIDLCLDARNPRILFAALWQAHRTPHSLVSGGPESGIFRSTDGGDTWEELSERPGLPRGIKGRIGLAVSPAKPGRVWAMIEAAEGGLFRSDDYGETWERVNDQGDLRQRPWYYMHVHADPVDPDTVYVLNVQMWRSTDGGRTFQAMPTPHADHHDLWIDPRDPRRMILGCDGGATVTFNGGLTWSTTYNQPTAEMYHVAVDRRFPYRVYGAQQDNTTLCVPSRCDKGPIVQSEWEEVGGGESGYIAVRPDDPDVVYAGSYQGYLTRYDRRTRQARNISVWPELNLGAGAAECRYRFQWTFPIVISPHDPGVLYVAGNHVFRSTDEGQSWEVISPDLTRNDPARLGPSGGPITRDNTGAEYYCTVFALAESPVQPGVIWAGTDDGLVWVTRDGGATWEQVTPPDLPEWALISIVEPSPHDAATAYVAATRYKHDDFRPYLYKTHDFGRTWVRITDGIPEDDFTRVIREDPERPGLLYAGTETGVYVSFDGGGRWHRLGGNLPVVPVHDLVVHERDLVVATHGRSFWILDDVTLLHQLADGAPQAPAHLFRPRDTVRWRSAMPPWSAVTREYTEAVRYAWSNGLVARYALVRRPDGEVEVQWLDAGENPPEGVVVHYWLAEAAGERLTLAFYDASGRLIREFRGRPAGPAERQAEGVASREEEPRCPAAAGLNRFVWDLREAGPRRVAGAMFWGNDAPGPRVPPGRYRVELRLGDLTLAQEFTVVKDPRVGATQEELEEQHRFLLQIRDRLSEVNEAIARIRELKRQAEEWARRARGTPRAAELERAAADLREKLEAVEGELIQTKARSRQDMLNHPVRLNVKLASLMGAVGSADAPPTRQARECFADLERRAQVQLQRLREIQERDVATFNHLVREAGLEPLSA